MKKLERSEELKEINLRYKDRRKIGEKFKKVNEVRDKLETRNISETNKQAQVWSRTWLK